MDAVRAAMGRAGVAPAVDVKPALALGGWVAMKAMSGGAIAMGDLVLTDDELSPVIARLQQGGVEQTAVHHHLLHEQPRIYHVHAHGDATTSARRARRRWASTSAPWRKR